MSYLGILLSTTMSVATIKGQTSTPIPVTAENFIRAESDLYFGAVVKRNGFGKFEFTRTPSLIEEQTVVRMNRDTLYGAAIFDLDAGPVTITLPDAGDRYLALQIIDEDQYTYPVYHGAGSHTFSKQQFGTRYIMAALRILADPNDPQDIKKGNALQDGVKVQQDSPGKFEVPNWDQVSQKKVRAALIELSTTLPDSLRMFGTKEQVDPVRRLIGAAALWGGNPAEEAIYLNFTPLKNDGNTTHKLVVKDVPVDGFWSISLYNAKGYFEKNDLSAYTLNNLTGKKGADGSVAIQFGGCNGKVPNCLPIMPGWNYTVRLYQPRKEILDGSWKFPEAQPVK